jgi:prepilin-type N-terminal cleavage/methylation domain-containing protein
MATSPVENRAFVRGFALIELMIVMAVIASSVTIAIPA